MHATNLKMKESAIWFTNDISLDGNEKGPAELRQWISSTTGVPHKNK